MARIPLSKRLAENAFVQRAASASIAAYIRLVERTNDWRDIGLEHAQPLLDAPDGLIAAFWHQRILMSPLMRSRTTKPVRMLISAHRDGDIIAGAVGGFGIEFIRGSAADPRKKYKEKGGAGALAHMLAALESGAIVGVTPDGPRGPARRVQPGVVRLAQLSGAPILPVAYSISRGRFLGTWDGFLLAAPFGRGCFVAGPPIRVAPDAGPEALEAARRQLEEGLEAVCARADDAAGLSPSFRNPG